MRRPGSARLVLVTVLLAMALAGAAVLAGYPSRLTPGQGAAREVRDTSTPPPETTGSLSPQFVECMAAQGYDVASPADFASVPRQALATCFGAVHGGGGAP